MISVGIDISKKKIDIWMDNKLVTLVNEQESIEKYFTPLKQQRLKIVMEATGRYHRISHTILAQLGFDVMVINPFQSRHFAKSMNVLCKTDKVDAKILCEYAQRMEFKSTPLLSSSESELRDLVRHLDDLKGILQQYQQRLEDAEGFSSTSLQRLIQNIKTEIKTTEKEIETIIKSDKSLLHRRNLLITVPGIGKTTAAAIIGLVSEIGKISNREIAALAGLAPMNFDSGGFKGKRRIQKGRHDLRRFLYMPCVGAATQHNKSLKALYKRLIEKGKPAKVALAACMRKLLIYANATLKQGTEWQLYEKNYVGVA